jgi:hypothetical protein
MVQRYQSEQVLLSETHELITDNLIRRTIVEHRKSVHAPVNLPDVSHQLALSVSTTRILRFGAIVLLYRNNVRNYALAVAQFDGLSRAKPGQEALGASQLTQSDRRHFRRSWHGAVALCYDIIGHILTSTQQS